MPSWEAILVVLTKSSIWIGCLDVIGCLVVFMSSIWTSRWNSCPDGFLKKEILCLDVTMKYEIQFLYALMKYSIQ